LAGRNISKSTVTATEAKPQTAHSHLCVFRSQNNLAVASIEVVGTPAGFAPEMTIDYMIATHRKGASRIHRVIGVGEAALFFTFDDAGVSRLDASKRSYGQTRTVIFTTDAKVPSRKFIAVATLVLSRM
jgi:hypothetical protein